MGAYLRDIYDADIDGPGDVPSGRAGRSPEENPIRHAVSVVVAVVLTGLFVSGLAYLCRYVEVYEWGSDPKMVTRQILAVLAVGFVVLAVYGINRLLNR